MPQAKNMIPFPVPSGSGGESWLSTLQNATANAPIRYAIPHQASALTRSWVQANSRNRPSKAVTQVEITNSVEMSKTIGSDVASKGIVFAPLVISLMGAFHTIIEGSGSK